MDPVKRRSRLGYWWILGRSHAHGRWGWGYTPSSLTLPRLSWWADGPELGVDLSIGAAGTDPVVHVWLQLPRPRWWRWTR